MIGQIYCQQCIPDINFNSATIAVPELTGNSFYILLPAKGAMDYRQIISIRLYVRIKQF